PDQVGEPCEPSWGSGEASTGFTGGEALDAMAGLDRAPTGPVARIREFFHHPTRELYLDLRLAPAAKPWRQAWLCLDLDEEWPEDEVITVAMFRLFVVPIDSLFTETAEPIKADGTRTTFPIHSWQPELRARY